MMPVQETEQAALSRRVIQALDNVNGYHAGFRPAHAKGILLTGSFLPAPGGASLTRAPHLHRDFTHVSVRFSDFAGVPNVPDASDDASPRGCAIRFHLGEHVHTDILAHSVNGFPARTAEEFAEFLEAVYTSGPGAVEPKPIAKFLAAHPVAMEFVQAPKPIPESFATESFFGVNAYRFTNESGRVQFGRYRVRPMGPSAYLDPEAAKQKPRDFLFDEIRQRLATGPLKLTVLVQLAGEEDIVDDSSIHWPEERPLIDFGTVYLTGIHPDDAAEQKHIIFDPLPRVDGIEPSKDPLLQVRADAYLISGSTAARRMNVMYISGEPALREGTAPEPQPAPDEVLVRVCAAGVVVTELQWYSTTHTKTGLDRKRTVPGHEFSGVVSQVGPDVHHLTAGDEVFGMNDWFRDGSLADFCLTEPSALAPKPKRLTHAEAASVPISALTAWQGLFDRAALRPGESVLVHGAAGAVGTFAVQLAKWKSAHVVATVSARNIALARELGADHVIDYQRTPFEQAGAFDVVFDTVGGDTLARSWNVLKPRGRLVTVASSSEASTDPRVKAGFFIVAPSGRLLEEIGRLLDAGSLRTVVDAVFPLAQAPDVYADRVVRRRQGKVVISIAGC